MEARDRIKVLVFACFFFQAVQLFADIAGAEDLKPATYHETAEKMPQMSIPELFDFGGTPTGSGYMHGMPWPVKELKKRPQKDVVDEALRRLKPNPKNQYDHAFAVYCLKELSIPKLKEILIPLYPHLDDAGKYEVLLFGVESKAPEFAPLFKDILEKSSKDELSRREMLAAEYASYCSGKEWIPGLKRLSEKMGRLNPRSLGQFLDGFPYSDVVMHSVDSPRKLVSTALENCAREWKLTSEEQKLTSEVQGLLLSPERHDVDCQNLPLNDVVVFLRKKFKTSFGRMDLKPYGVDASTIRVTVQLKQASLSDILASICNQTGLTVYRGLSIHQFYQGNMKPKNHCVAVGGNVVEVSTSPLTKELNALWGEGPQVDCHVDCYSPLEVIQGEGHMFRLEELSGKNKKGSQDNHSIDYGIFDVSITEEDEKSGKVEIAEIKGRVCIFVPNMVRRVEVELDPSKIIEVPPTVEGRQKGKIEFGEGFFMLLEREMDSKNRIKKIHFEWGSEDENPMKDLGDLEFFNEKGELMEPQIMSSGGGGGSIGTRRHTLSILASPLPKKVVWTFFPHGKFQEFPVVFKDVVLPLEK